jgi:DNA polymerase III delta prime subunit
MKAGISLEPFIEEIEKISGTKPYGLEEKIEEAKIKGKGGLQEILEKSLGEEKSLAIVKEVEDILGTSSPYQDSVFELVDYEKQTYAVANLKSLVVATARLVEENGEKRIVYKTKVCPVAPTQVTVYRSPIGGLTKFEIVFEGKTQDSLRIGPCSFDDIITRLSAEGLFYNSRLSRDIMSAIIQGFIRKGKAEIKHEIESPGFFIVDDKLNAIKVERKDVSKEELKEALLLLNELAEVWFRHVIERFAIVVKWGLVAPFGFVYKQKGRFMPWLYLYGSSLTGKTTLGKIGLSLWGLDISFEKTGSSIDTIPRLGYILSQSTFPVLINEPGSAISREEVVEVMKNAIETTLVRGKFEHNVYQEKPSLSPLIFASNKIVPRDDALLRRLLVLRFSYGERISPEKAKEFEEKVKPRLGELSVIGRWTTKELLENPKLLEMEWHELAIFLFQEMYKEAELEVPEWIKLRPEDENIFEDIKEAIKAFLLKEINKEYSLNISRLGAVEVTLEERVQKVLEDKLLPYAKLQGDKVYFNSEFARELSKVIGDIGGLKSIAELLGWNYQIVKLGKTARVAGVPLEKFVDFLNS